MSRSAIALVSVYLLWGVAPARANTLDAPAVVGADKTGAFRYEAVFTAKDPVIIGGYMALGFPADNMRGVSWYADCFCPPPDYIGCPLDPGEELVIPVDGSLVNPSEGGTVTITLSLCSGGHFQVSTTVVPWVPIETVPVGNPGNAGELSGEGQSGEKAPERICGAVGYVYNIGKFEVTAGQYTEFLNAVAATATYGLYNTSMDNSFLGCQITQNGKAGSYTYDFSGRPSGTEADWVDRPVNFVSWGDAARLANWLHNGQPGLDTPVPQDEDSTEDGAYDLSATQGYYGPDGQSPPRYSNDWYWLNNALLAVVRKPNATWVIPSEDEWYKAAYYDGGSNVYYDYPTSTDAVPNNGNLEGDTGNSANFYEGDGDYTIGSPYYRTEVGFFELSDSPYGTFDQGGNVWEWNEAVPYRRNRGLRGGSFYSDDYLYASYRDIGGFPTYKDAGIGFRVAELPEPDCTHDGDEDGDVDLYDFALYQATFADARCYALFHMAFNGPQ